MFDKPNKVLYNFQKGDYMTIENTFRYLVGAYYGILELDEYSTKEYLLKDIENYIKEYVSQNKKNDIDFQSLSEDVDNNVSLKVKFQDCLLVLPKVQAPLEVILLVKARLARIEEETYNM